MSSPRPSLAGLTPAYFALVMATGIVSLAAHMHRLPSVALALLWCNAAAWLLLVGLNALRLARYPRAFLGDLADHVRGPGFFTAVAGTSVLGTQFLVLRGNVPIAWGLATVAMALWTVLTYAIFTAFTIKDQKPTLEKGISGTWLLVVVATQSIAVLGTLLAPHAEPSTRAALEFVALSMWLGGGMLYVWLMTLIFYRCVFFRLSIEELSPPYWINMGAMAISTLAGALLVGNAADSPLLASLLPFLKGLTLLYWATGTWWIPLLLLLGAWRYLYRHFPFHYEPLYWGMVFPLGMYSASTHQMAVSLSLELPAVLSTGFFYAALVAWAATAAGLLRWAGRAIVTRRRTGGND